MQFGLCAGPESAPDAHAAGLTLIELHVQNHLMPLTDEYAFAPMADTIAAMPIPTHSANCFLPGHLKATGPDHDPDAVLAYARTAFARAQHFGIDTIVFGSGGARQLDATTDRETAFDQFITLNKKLAPLAADHGITIVIEPLHAAECNFINSLAEGARVVEAVDHPHVRLLTDFFHMLRDDEPADEIVRFGDMITHAHLAEPAIRTAPGIEGTDFQTFFNALTQINYTGNIFIEGSYPNGVTTDATNALQLMQTLWKEATHLNGA